MFLIHSQRSDISNFIAVIPTSSATKNILFINDITLSPLKVFNFSRIVSTESPSNLYEYLFFISSLK